MRTKQGGDEKKAYDDHYFYTVFLWLTIAQFAWSHPKV